MILRPYQTEAVEAAISAPEPRIGLALATGLGKTVIAREICRHYQEHWQRVVFVVPSTELMRQAARTLGTEELLGQGQSPNWRAPIIVATIQSLSRRLPEMQRANPDVLILDEFHHAAARSYDDLMALKWKRVVCLSATAFRADGKALRHAVDRVVFERDLNWGIAQGFLCPYDIVRPKKAGSLPLTVETVQMKKADGTERVMERVSYDHEERNKIVAALAEEVMSRNKCECGIMFCSTVEHARKMATAMGPEWDWCSGDRREGLERFKRGEVRGIVSVQLVLEGFDHPKADFLCVNGGINARTTGKIRWIQLLGRILRLHPGKECSIALDLTDAGLPPIEYRSALDGISEDAEDDSEAVESELTVLQRLEQPMLLTLEDLLMGLREVGAQQVALQQRLKTRLKLREVEPGRYLVIGTRWAIWQSGPVLWAGTDGFHRLSPMSMEDLEKIVQPKKYACSEVLPPSDAQHAMLVKIGMKPEDIARLTRAQASEYIDHHIASRESEPATPKQLGFIRWQTKKDPGPLTKSQARRIIATIQARK